MEKPRDAAFAGSVEHDFCAPTIHRVKVILAQHPHARQRGKVVDLPDIIECFSHNFRIDHRSFDILRSSCCGA